LTPDSAAWEDLLHGLETSAFAGLVRGSLWLYPVAEILHIIGFAVLVGVAFVFDLRLLGLLRALPIADAVRHLTRWARRSLLVVVPTGLVLFMVDATTLAGNSAFQLKLVLIAAAGVNAGVFHWVTFRNADAWGGTASLPLAARLAGVVSILLWFSVIACGRMIAYV
jgi:hypothetical protein